MRFSRTISLRISWTMLITQNRHANLKNYLFIGFICFTLLLVCLCILKQNSSWLKYIGLTFLMGIVVLLGINFCSVSFRSGKFDLTEIPIWISLWTLGIFVPFGLFGYGIDIVPTFHRTSWLADGLWIPIIGLAGMWLGYKLGWILSGTKKEHPIQKLKLGFKLSEPKLITTVAFFCIISLIRIWIIHKIGIAYKWNMASLGAYEAWNQWLILVKSLNYLILAITIFQVFRKRWPSYLFIIMTAIELAFIFISGFKGTIIDLFVLFYAGLYYSTEDMEVFRRSFLKLAIFTATAAIIFIPAGEMLRTAINAKLINIHSGKSIATNSVIIFHKFKTKKFSILFKLIRLKLLDDFSAMTEGWGIFIHATPSRIPYWGVKSLLATPIYLIPRILWSNKPNLSTGFKVAIEYMGALPQEKTSVAATIFGDLYLHAGFLAVFLGMIIFGVISAFLYRIFIFHYPHEERMLILPLYITVIALTIFDVEGTFIGVIDGMIQQFIFFGLFFLLLHWTPLKQSAGINSE